jgi:hypothetical protein
MLPMGLFRSDEVSQNFNVLHNFTFVCTSCAAEGNTVRGWTTADMFTHVRDVLLLRYAEYLVRNYPVKDNHLPHASGIPLVLFLSQLQALNRVPLTFHATAAHQGIQYTLKPIFVGFEVLLQPNRFDQDFYEWSEAMWKHILARFKLTNVSGEFNLHDPLAITITHAPVTVPDNALPISSSTTISRYEDRINLKTLFPLLKSKILAYCRYYDRTKTQAIPFPLLQLGT